MHRIRIVLHAVVAISSSCFVALLQACTSAQPEDIVGLWAVEQLLVDGMDRTAELPSLPWGTAIAFAADGTFHTNGRKNNSGSWHMNSGGTAVFLNFQQKNLPAVRWEMSISKEYMVLKTTTRQLLCYRTEHMPVLPPVAVHLENNLPGTWYFYRMHSRGRDMQYPQSRRQARWMKIHRDGTYQSGEGKGVTFRGRWLLRHDTLTFSDTGRPWKQSWKIRMDEQQLLYFHALPPDTAAWEWVSFIKENSLSP